MNQVVERFVRPTVTPSPQGLCAVAFRLFSDRWVVSWFSGYTANLRFEWDGYRAAKNALKNVLTRGKRSKTSREHWDKVNALAREIERSLAGPPNPLASFASVQESDHRQSADRSVPSAQLGHVQSSERGKCDSALAAASFLFGKLGTKQTPAAYLSPSAMLRAPGSRSDGWREHRTTPSQRGDAGVRDVPYLSTAHRNAPGSN